MLHHPDDIQPGGSDNPNATGAILGCIIMVLVIIAFLALSGCSNTYSACDHYKTNRAIDCEHRSND